MKNEIALIEIPQELMEFKESSELKSGDAESILVRFAPYFHQLNEIKKEISKVNFENPTELDSEIADKIRKKIVKVRTASEKEKSDINSDFLILQRISVGANNILKGSCQLEENKLNEIAKYLEIQEAKRLAILKEERTALILPYGFNIDDAVGLEKMTEEVWNTFLTGIKKGHDDRIEAEKKAEEDRIAKEKAEAEERERMKVENEKLKAEALIKEKQLADEKAKADAERKEMQEKADKLKAESDAKLKAEQEAKQKLEAELKAKADAERKEAERLVKVEQERIAKEEEEAKAPKKEKLNNWIDNFVMGSPTGMNEDEMVVMIQSRFESFKKWAKGEIEKL